MLRKIARLITSRFQRTSAERWCAVYFGAKAATRSHAGKAAPLVVIEGVEDLFFYILHAEIVTTLRGMRNIRVARWAARSLEPAEFTSPLLFIAGRVNRYVLSRLKWKRLYDAFCDDKGDRADYLRAPWREISWLWRAWRLFRSLTGKDQLASLRVKEILIGDLVIDTYLRFKPAVEVNLRDLYLLLVLRQALKDVDTVRAYFTRARPSIYLTTYTTYIQHGVPARVAVAMGIATWSFANGQEFGTRLTSDHLLQTRRCANYSVDFSGLPDQESKLNQAAILLGGRVSGVADTATSNMRSAYEVRTQDVPDVSGAAVVFLHDFYDSPHIYHWMIFHDFWEWACVTIDILEEAGLPFFVKPHPNQRIESGAELKRLSRKYPRLRFISPEVSNRQLVDAGMACAITVYGSVAAEMAYLGVPSIACGDNPHASFDTFYLATTKEQYRDMVRNFRNLSCDPALMKSQACAFFFMHNMNIGPEELELRDRMFEFFVYMMNLEAQKSFDPAEMAAILSSLENVAGFQSLVTNMASELH